MTAATAVFIALFVWWFATGALLWLVSSTKERSAFILSAATLVLVCAGAGLAQSAQEMTLSAVYISFLCGIVIWGWNELVFLSGWVTGPEREPLPEGVSAWERFSRATATVIYHELVLLLTLLIMAALTWDAPNQIGLWTCLVLWIMRLSSKFNIFLGVKNVAEEFLPPHLVHLKSYFRKRPMNWLFPISVVLGGGVAGALGREAFVSTSPAEIAGFTLLTTLLVLALVEHLFLVLPLNETALWRWAKNTQRSHF